MYCNVPRMCSICSTMYSTTTYIYCIKKTTVYTQYVRVLYNPQHQQERRTLCPDGWVGKMSPYTVTSISPWVNYSNVTYTVLLANINTSEHLLWGHQNIIFLCMYWGVAYMVPSLQLVIVYILVYCTVSSLQCNRCCTTVPSNIYTLYIVVYSTHCVLYDYLVQVGIVCDTSTNRSVLRRTPLPRRPASHVTVLE